MNSGAPLDGRVSHRRAEEISSAHRRGDCVAAEVRRRIRLRLGEKLRRTKLGDRERLRPHRLPLCPGDYVDARGVSAEWKRGAERKRVDVRAELGETHYSVTQRDLLFPRARHA